MSRWRPLVCGGILTVSHFLASLLIIPLTLRVGESLAGGSADSWVYALLTLVTKILYFPLMALALYPRHWFPGHLITIPIAVNSLLWGGALTVVMVVWRHLRKPAAR
ncbi:MAG: hypothetical protein PVJ53_08725 [Desulfobacterales bacterium]|jgi:hypothetical protein